jgi:hypothetical protein
MVQVVSVTVRKAEDDAPVASDPDGIKPGIVAAQRMQFKARDVDVLDLPSLVDDRQPVFDAANLVGGQSARVAFLEQFPQFLLLNDRIIANRV